MNGETNHTIYTAKDMEAYFSGRLLPNEMHAIEKAALDDPFLAEAMEGYQAMQGTAYNDALLSLKEQLNNGAPVAKVVPMNPSTFKWWRIVAAVLILGGGIALTYTLATKKQATDKQIGY